MKYIFSVIIFFASLQCRCQSQSDLKIGIVDKNYLYQIEGRIGNLQIKMFYRISQNSISGYYFYEKYYQPINILGSIDNGIIQIYEFDAEFNKSAFFKGNVIDKSTLNGDWINLKNNKKTQFELKGEIIPFENLEGKVFIKSNNILKFYNVTDSLITKPFDFYLFDYSRNEICEYLLFKIGGSSNPNGGGKGFCGTGYEEKIVLMQIDNNFNVLKKSSHLINSCLRNYETNEIDINWIEGKYLNIKGSCVREKINTQFVITYDKSNPDNGLKIEFNKR